MVRKFRFYDPQSGESTLGTTTTESIQITGADGAIFHAQVYISLNVVDHPELRQQLIDGSLNVVNGPDGEVYRPAVPVLVHDPKAQVFALVIPEALRHQQLPLRAAVLEGLAEYADDLPAYFLDIPAIFDPDEFATLGRSARPPAASGTSEATVVTDVPTGASEASQQALKEEVAALKEKLERRDNDVEAAERARGQLQEKVQSLQDELQAFRESQAADSAESGEGDADELQAEREQLAIDRAQLEEVASRVERDSARVDEAMSDIQRQRSELESQRQELKEERRKLQVQELNLEQERLRLQSEGQAAFADGDKPHANEATQVVTDDQFIEVVEAEESEAEVEAQAFSEPDMLADGAPSIRPEPTTSTIVSYDSEEIFDDFADGADDAEDPSFVASTSGLIVAGFRLAEDRALRFLDGQVRFLFQCHDVDGVPLIALTLACFDDDGECVESVAVALADKTPREQALLDQLARDLHLHLAIYDDEEGQRLASWEAGAPIRHNIGWARQKLRAWRQAHDDHSAVTAAAHKISAGERDLVGTMRHPFESQEFTEFSGASDVRLAVSIVSYWSQPEQKDYLIGNRAYPLETFEQIQKRVVRQALHWGIAPGDQLRQIAIDEAIILDNVSLVQRLLSNFAEVCVGLRPNDLDPLEQWENWDALIQLAQSYHITPDPDVLELAEVSLKRAEEYDEVFESEAAAEAVRGGASKVVAHEGPVTYFLPADYDHGEEGFDLMMDADNDRLRELLDDQARRLMAAQAFLEKAGPAAVSDVLGASEALDAREAQALSRFVEARADGLEASLMQGLNSAGPVATLVIARALVAVENTAAIPRLLDAIRDADKQDDLDGLAETVAGFGDKLVPPLSRVLKKNPDDPALLATLVALERRRPGTIEELADDRSKGLQQAAKTALAKV